MQNWQTSNDKGLKFTTKNKTTFAHPKGNELSANLNVTAPM